MRISSYEAHRRARIARSRLAGLVLGRALRAARRWRRSFGPGAWLRPLNYG